MVILDDMRPFYYAFPIALLTSWIVAIFLPSLIDKYGLMEKRYAKMLGKAVVIIVFAIVYLILLE